MAIDLKPEQQVTDLAVRSGAYRNPGEVLDQAFEIIQEQLDLEDWMIEEREAVAAHIEPMPICAHRRLWEPKPPPQIQPNPTHRSRWRTIRGVFGIPCLRINAFNKATEARRLLIPHRARLSSTLSIRKPPARVSPSLEGPSRRSTADRVLSVMSCYLPFSMVVVRRP
jgi:hypothetical protein